MATFIGGVYLDTARLDALIATIPGKAEEIVQEGAFLVQGRAIVLAPIDTGALASSINVGGGGLLRIVQDGKEYGIYQELGTYKMRAQPFMGPALEWARPKFEKMWPGLFK